MASNWTKPQFEDYLKDILIPDLIDDGRECTAEDLCACLLFMNGITLVKESDTKKLMNFLKRRK